MTTVSASRPLATVGLIALLIAGGASAQASRTWVSGVGDDANPCSRTAPCKTFAGAISKTAAGGEINAIDPGGFGAVTITKAITIDGGEALASILATGTNAIVVNAGVNDVVTIRNLSINGLGTGLNGIRFLGGGTLRVENVHILTFSQKGIDFAPASNASLYLHDVEVTSAVGGGILIKPGAGAFVGASIDESRLTGSQYGLRVEDRSTVVARSSLATGNTGAGFHVRSATESSRLTLEGCNSSNNQYGVYVFGALTTAHITGVTATDNTTGLAAPSGALISLGNNTVAGNGTDGAPTSTVATM